MRWAKDSRPTLIVALSVGMAFSSAGARESFHPPATESEKALDAILRHADHDDDLLDNLLAGRGDRKFHQTVDYSATLSSQLIAAIRAKEAAMVKKDCGGHYRSGDICGLDYSPITCGQDSPDTYLYRTDAAGAGMAEISYAWPDSPKATATYKLVQLAGHWKIDGVRCESGESFNFAGQ